MDAFYLSVGVCVEGLGVFGEEDCGEEGVDDGDGAFVAGEFLDDVFEVDVAFEVEVGGAAVEAGYFEDVFGEGG